MCIRDVSARLQVLLAGGYCFARCHAVGLLVRLCPDYGAMFRLCRPLANRFELLNRSDSGLSCCGLQTFLFLIVLFLSASLYFSKRGAYGDRLCRDVVGRWLVVTRVHCGQTVHPRPIVTMEH